MKILYQKILGTAVRVPDPWVQLSGPWIVRRLAPDCSRVELAALPKDRDEQKLLHAMGRETANIHAGDDRAKAAIRADLQRDIPTGSRKPPRQWPTRPMRTGNSGGRRKSCERAGTHHRRARPAQRLRYRSIGLKAAASYRPGGGTSAGAVVYFSTCSTRRIAEGGTEPGCCGLGIEEGCPLLP